MLQPDEGAETSPANLATSLPAPSTVEVESSTESSTATPRHPTYPKGVPSKFTPNGTVQPFPGNTILSHLPPSSDLYTSLLHLHSKLTTLSSRFHLAILPPSSYHMTIFEGVCDQVRSPGFWPDDLPPSSSSMEECTSLFATKLADFDLGNACPPYRLRVAGVLPLEVGIALRLVPINNEEGSRMRGLRDKLAGRLGIRHPGHEGYEFHVGLGYLLRFLGEEEEKELMGVLKGFLEEEGMASGEFEVEVGGPEFCTFESMELFERVFYLGDSEGV